MEESSNPFGTDEMNEGFWLQASKFYYSSNREKQIQEGYGGEKPQEEEKEDQGEIKGVQGQIRWEANPKDVKICMGDVQDDESEINSGNIFENVDYSPILRAGMENGARKVNSEKCHLEGSLLSNPHTADFHNWFSDVGWIQKCQAPTIEPDWDYSNLVDQLLNRSDQYGTSLKHRRDVVNKKILRAFKKYISSIFDSRCKKPSKLKKSFKILKKNLLEDAVKLGLYYPENNDVNTEEYRDFIWWMAMKKMTKKTKEQFNYKGNNSIKTLSEILEKYSHSKLERLFESKIIGKVYSYFLQNGLSQFISSIPKISKKVYHETAFTLMDSFNVYL